MADELIQVVQEIDEADLERYRRECFNIGISTQTANWLKFEEAVRELYKMLKLAAPSFEHLPSPKACLDRITDATWFHDYLWGQHEIYWIAYYRYAREKLGVRYSQEHSDQLDLWYEIACSANWWWPFDDVCLVADRMEVCALEYDGPGLHREDGPAVRFRDGWEMYFLNGVPMAQEIVMTPAHLLDPRLLISTTNVEERREILRKIGIDRAMDELKGVVIDELGGPDDPGGVIGGPYELINLDLGDGRVRPHLQMINQSHKGDEPLYHIEGVPPTCTTVDEALDSRKPPEMRKIPVSESGEDWVLQGDVHVWPRDAKSLKRYPCKIT